MEKIYIPAFYSLGEIETIIKNIEDEGLDATQIIVADSFADFISKIDPEKDTVAVYSLVCFASMIDLLSAARSVTIRSLREPWFTEPIADPREYLASMHELAVAMHAARTNRGLRKARQDGRQLGRAPKSQEDKSTERSTIAQIEKMCAEQRISISQACKLIGFSRHKFYRLRREM